MSYGHLDDDELLRLSLDALHGNKDSEAIAMLQALVDRGQDNAYAQYLLAAQHAQLGLMDRAERGFRAAIALAPELEMARFQLGQLLVLKGDMDQVASILMPLQTDASPALAAYGAAFIALAEERVPAAIEQLELGLTYPQAVPVLAQDMRQLLTSLRAHVSEGTAATTQPEPATSAAGSLLLTNYNRYN